MCRVRGEDYDGLYCVVVVVVIAIAYIVYGVSLTMVYTVCVEGCMG